MSSSLNKFNVVVAGHICLDVIPDLGHLPEGRFASLFQPGQIVSVGPAAFSTGGLVSNTGLALFRLGIATRLVAKVGDDLFGTMVTHLVRRDRPSLAEGLAASAADTTSYTIIINPPGVDRIFLHCPGANDTFCAQDIDYSLLAGASLFHFGYPPLMRQMYADDGQELAKIFKQAKAAGVTTSLDMAFPDPSSEGGKANWSKILSSVLPDVDLFQPSVEELLFMLRREEYERLANQSSRGDVLAGVTPELLCELLPRINQHGREACGSQSGCSRAVPAYRECSRSEWDGARRASRPVWMVSSGAVGSLFPRERGRNDRFWRFDHRGFHLRPAERFTPPPGSDGCGGCRSL